MKKDSIREIWKWNIVFHLLLLFLFLVQSDFGLNLLARVIWFHTLIKMFVFEYLGPTWIPLETWLKRVVLDHTDFCNWLRNIRNLDLKFMIVFGNFFLSECEFSKISCKNKSKIHSSSKMVITYYKQKNRVKIIFLKCLQVHFHSLVNNYKNLNFGAKWVFIPWNTKPTYNC